MGSTIDLEKVVVYWVAMTTPSIQYNKNPEHKSSRRDFKLGAESEISGSLKNLKPEKIGLSAKFNRYVHFLVIPKFGGPQ